jgi:Xaa-Pro aminopeptidase
MIDINQTADQWAEKLAALRQEMTQQNLAGFIVPMADEYQNEYVPPSARRIEYLTGFTGSAGVVVVLQDQAAFFTDSRYTLQAAAQVPAALYTLFDSAEKTPRDWLAAILPSGARFGYDAWLHAVAGVERLREALPAITLVPVIKNPLDAIWLNRPLPPAPPIVLHGVDYAGQESSSKRNKIAMELARKNIAALIISDPTSIAWLLNVRGSDVPHTPLPLSFAIMRADATVDWFVDPRKTTPALLAGLGQDIHVHAPDDFIPMLQQWGQQKSSVQLDPNLCSAAIADCLIAAGAVLVRADDPCALPRACKNTTEQNGMRDAHQRDAVALVQFFSWLAAQPAGTVSELQAEAELEACRQRQPLYCEPSFATIAGSGAHGAIVHYRATQESNRVAQAGELFLIDSGGQYRDGTTDVTRTVAIGTPTAHMREHYTRVVKGHIALAAIRFPVGTSGAELDILARQFLWQVGLDYGHGTGHGVGCYLSVHEGPQGISRRSRVVLQTGMVLSNEPGFYLAGQYGIRFENLMLVTEAAIPSGGTIPMLGFETLTLVPLERSLLQLDLLTASEIAWINAYHARVCSVVADQLNASEQAWLFAQTAPLP